MRSGGADKALLLVALMIVVIAATVAIVMLSLRRDEMSDLIAANERLSVLISVELDDGTLVTQAFFHQPATDRGALFDIPPNTGVVVRAVDRVDSIDTAYFASGPQALLAEVSTLLGEPIAYRINLTADSFVLLVDLAEGVPLFIADVPNEGPDRLAVPNGEVVLDGAKALAYLAYEGEGERDRERVSRRQKIIVGLLVRLGERAPLLADPATVRLIHDAVDTTIDRQALVSLFSELGALTPDRVITRQVEGVVRTVQTDAMQKALVFPHQETRWLKESVRQVVTNLASDESIVDENLVIRLEILNGTEQIGLAARTAELYRGFGFDVVAVGNSTRSDVETTMVINRTGNETFARRTADVIRARATDVQPDGPAAVDVTVVLGRDFDGRYVR